MPATVDPQVAAAAQAATAAAEQAAPGQSANQAVPAESQGRPATSQPVPTVNASDSSTVAAQTLAVPVGGGGSTGGDAAGHHSGSDKGAKQQPSDLTQLEQAGQPGSSLQTPAQLTDARPAAPAAPQAQTPVPLAQLAQAAQAAIRVTAGSGGTSVTIVMHPQELGTVEIRLRYGADGIAATVHADNPQAAQTLQQAAPDLRRSLEAQGMTLLSLDVGDGTGHEAADPNPGHGSRGGSSAGEGDDVDEIAGVVSGVRREPAAGSQIDVLA